VTGADTQLDLVTGASSYSGSHIAEGLLDAGRRVRTLTFHPDRPHPLRGRVEVLPYRFDDQAALTKNPSRGGHALQHLLGSLRSRRDDIHQRDRQLASSFLRRLPIFAIPGNGGYAVQPVHVDDLARICVQSAGVDGDEVNDAAGPETMTFAELVRAVGRAVGACSPTLHLPPAVISAASRVLGLLVHDVVLTQEEISGLTAGLLVSRWPPLGQIAFSDWLAESSDSIGSFYANELQRHFAIPAASR